MKITLVRHGEVQEEYIGKYNGHIDISLSKNGKAQAKKIAKELSKEIFDKVYCSDLLRARQTLEAFHITSDVIFTSALREKSWGIHEGKSFTEIESSGIKYKNFKQWIEALDGEDMSLYQEKVYQYFKEICSTKDIKHILIITHSGFMKSLLSFIHDLSLEEAFKISIPYASSLSFDTNNIDF